MNIDPVTTEVVASRLREAASSMEHALYRSGYSPILRESKDGTSGLKVFPYTDSDKTAWGVIAPLLDAGESGGRRYLGHVTPERYLRVEEEESEPTTGEGGDSDDAGGQASS